MFYSLKTAIRRAASLLRRPWYSSERITSRQSSMGVISGVCGLFGTPMNGVDLRTPGDKDNVYKLLCVAPTSEQLLNAIESWKAPQAQTYHFSNVQLIGGCSAEVSFTERFREDTPAYRMFTLHIEAPLKAFKDYCDDVRESVHNDFAGKSFTHADITNEVNMRATKLVLATLPSRVLRIGFDAD